MFGGPRKHRDWSRTDLFEDVLWNEVTEEQQSARELAWIKRLRLLERIQGSGLEIAIDFAPRAPRLVLVDRMEPRPLELSFSEYLEWCEMTLGLSYWQYQFTATRIRVSELDETVHRYFPQHLPRIAARSAGAAAEARGEHGRRGLGRGSRGAARRGSAWPWRRSPRCRSTSASSSR